MIFPIRFCQVRSSPWVNSLIYVCVTLKDIIYFYGLLKSILKFGINRNSYALEELYQAYIA